jgi:hypothetical protein
MEFENVNSAYDVLIQKMKPISKLGKKEKLSAHCRRLHAMFDRYGLHQF